MRRFVKYLHREKGFTIVELLASLTLLVIVLGLVSTVAVFGFRSYYKIKIEGDLRQEGDLLISSLITEFYTFAPDRVRSIGEDRTGIVLERDKDSVTLEQKMIEITPAGTLWIGKTVEVAANEPYDPPQAVTDEEAIAAKAGDSRTSIKSEISPEDSFIDVECRLLNPCESGLINVKLQLSTDYDSREYELGLESKFGF